LLASLAGAGIALWLLAWRVWPIVSPGRNLELEVILLFLLGLPALVGALFLTVTTGCLLWRGQRAALGPLLAGISALAIVALPLSPAMRDLDDRLHRAAREEVALRLESGDLRDQPGLWGSSGGLAALPPEQPNAVSYCGGHRLVDLWRDGAALRVTFCPHGGARNGGWWVVYDSADRTPLLTEPYLAGWTFGRVERLRERWFRLVKD
jgi:hypothetical protein